MAVNVELIKVLRDRTGAGIMDCKNALAACENDVDKACDWLREKGIAKQAKKADRIAAEGLVLVHNCEKCGKASVVEVNCETDFVSKADPFRDLVNACAETVLKENCKTVEEAVEKTAPLFTDATVKLGEKLSFRRFEIVEPKGEEKVYSYIHMGGKIGVLVLLAKEDAELGKGLAMHIAANNPKFIHFSDIPAAQIENEKNIQIEACKNDPKLAGKPEVALKKIVEGKVNKFFSESVLDEQSYLLDPEKTVAQVLKEKGNSVVKFIRYQVGEGIEKRQENFAEEVAKQAN